MFVCSVGFAWMCVYEISNFNRRFWFDFIFLGFIRILYNIFRIYVLRGTLKSSRFRFPSYNFFFFFSHFSRSINYSMMDVAFLFENITFRIYFLAYIQSYNGIVMFSSLIVRYLFLKFIPLINNYKSRYYWVKLLFYKDRIEL